MIHNISILFNTKFNFFLFFRDLKPENILIDSTTLVVKVADFGLSLVKDHSKQEAEEMRKIRGSPGIYITIVYWCVYSYVWIVCCFDVIKVVVYLYIYFFSIYESRSSPGWRAYS